MARRFAVSTLSVSALALGTAARLVLNAYRPAVQARTLPLAGLEQPLRLALLTDLHLGHFIGLGSIRRWVNMTLTLRPELILLGGDLLDSARALRQWPALLRELSRLRAPLGVFAVWGNHDHKSFGAGLDTAASELALAGIGVLNNKGLYLRPDLYLAGSGDFVCGEQRPERYLAGYEKGACLLLSHNPDLLPELPPAVGLLLSGHTHGGQLNFPLTGPWHHGSKHRFVAGLVQRGSQRVYISRGLGVTFLPLRWRAEPELSLLTLVP